MIDAGTLHLPLRVDQAQLVELPLQEWEQVSRMRVPAGSQLQQVPGRRGVLVVPSEVPCITELGGRS